MTLKKNNLGTLAQVSTYLGAALELAFGVVYMLRTEFMPYHARAVGMAWADIDRPFQILLLAGMKLAAAGFLGFSISIIFLQYKYIKERISWIPWLILYMAGMSFIGTMTAILLVKLNTPGDPPYYFALASMLLIFFGFLCNRKLIRE